MAAEVLDVFDRSLTEKELVSQSKALCRDYILSRLHQNGQGWSKTELHLSPSSAALAEVSLVLLCLGKRNTEELPTSRLNEQSASRAKVLSCPGMSKQLLPCVL